MTKSNRVPQWPGLICRHVNLNPPGARKHELHNDLHIFGVRCHTVVVVQSRVALPRSELARPADYDVNPFTAIARHKTKKLLKEKT